MLQFWSLEVCVALGLVVSAVLLREAARLIDRRDLLAMTLPLALAHRPDNPRRPPDQSALLRRANLPERRTEPRRSRRAQMCNDGTIENGRLRCSIGEYNKEPYAYPHLLSLVYRAFGVGTTPAFVVNAVAAGLAVCLVYLLVAILFEDRLAAFFAALLLALTPEQLVWSATAAAEPSASCASVAALLAAAWFVRSRSTASLVGAAVAAAYAIQFRPESLLIVPVIAVMIWQRAREEFTRPRLWWGALLCLALAAVHVGHLAAVRNDSWGTTHGRVSLAYVAANLRVNGWFYVADARFPAAYSVLALVGLFWRRIEAGRLALALYFLLFFGIALLFYAGSYDYGADVRYSLATYPSLVSLAGLGAAGLIRGLGRVRLQTPAFCVVVSALAVQFVWYLPVVRSTSDGAWAPRADVRFAMSLVPDLRGPSYVLTQNPAMFQVWGISAGQLSLAAANPARLDALAQRYTGGVYVHWNFWCNTQDRVQSDLCDKVLRLRPVELVRQEWERDQRYALYRLKVSPPSTSTGSRDGH